MERYFVLGFVVAGLNYRWQWCMLPHSVVVVASVLFCIAYFFYGEVIKENTFLSRTIEVQENQKVITSGMYGIVRHPMYLTTIVMFLMIPLILGSIFSFCIFLTYPLIIVKRIRNEEKVLEEQLEGYLEYEKKVKFRLIPGIW